MNLGRYFTLRTFDGWGAVYLHDEKVFEGDEGHCIAFVFEQLEVTREQDDAHIADNERAAESLAEAKEYQELHR
jgi:hypothetical protein